MYDGKVLLLKIWRLSIDDQLNGSSEKLKKLTSSLTMTMWGSVLLFFLKVISNRTKGLHKFWVELNMKSYYWKVITEKL